MKLIRSSENILARQQVIEIAAFIVHAVLPEGGNPFSLISEEVDRINLCFQEDLGKEEKSHVHKDIILTNWPGSWGKFCTIKIDRDNARLQIWGNQYNELRTNDLKTRDGKLMLNVIIKDIQLNKEKHKYVLQTEFNTIENVGRCCHDGVLTISYRLRRKVEPPPNSLMYEVKKFLNSLGF
jgi:hypothetical protein